MIYLVINDISKVGGLSKVALNLYGEFKKNGYETKIITGNLDDANECYYEQAKADIINLGLGSVHCLAENKIKLLKWYYEFYKALKREKIKDATVIGIETVINFITVLALHNGRNRLIGSEHTAFQRRGITQFLKKRFYPTLNRLVVLTEMDRALYEAFGLKNVTVIPNFIENALDVSSLEHQKILFVGNLERVKGVDLLIDIVKKFDNKAWRFVIVGKGELQKELKEALLGYNVDIKGEILDPKEFYLNADIFILTSRKEGFPMVLLEAKNYGLPIVSFDVQTGPKEMIENSKDGFLVPFGDVEMFVERLQVLTKDHRCLQKMAQKSKESVVRYTPEKVMRKWFQII